MATRLPCRADRNRCGYRKVSLCDDMAGGGQWILGGLIVEPYMRGLRDGVESRYQDKLSGQYVKVNAPKLNAKCRCRWTSGAADLEFGIERGPALTSMTGPHVACLTCQTCAELKMAAPGGPLTALNSLATLPLRGLGSGLGALGLGVQLSCRAQLQHQ